MNEFAYNLISENKFKKFFFFEKREYKRDRIYNLFLYNLVTLAVVYVHHSYMKYPSYIVIHYNFRLKYINYSKTSSDGKIIKNDILLFMSYPLYESADYNGNFVSLFFSKYFHWRSSSRVRFLCIFLLLTHLNQHVTCLKTIKTP